MADNPTFKEYGVQVIQERLNKMLSYTRAVRRADDIEALHDMRVASRRLRAAINVFEPAFPGEGYRSFEQEVKAVTDALGEARDLDVMLDTLVQLEKTVPINQRGGLESFAHIKAIKRRSCQKDVIKAFEKLERYDMVEWFKRLSAEETLDMESDPDRTASVKENN